MPSQRTDSLRRTRRTFLRLEELEARLVLSGIEPTAIEQEFLERLNDARANPTAYGQSIGLDLSGVAPSQPLAFNPELIQAALGHSQDMNANNYFDHTSLAGQDPGARIAATGFSWTSWGESIAGGYNTPEDALQGLIIDAGVPDLGHRMQLLAMTPTFQTQEQVGIGIVLNGTGDYHDYYTIDSASSANTEPFLTGVVYNDLNGNHEYDAGEGLGGVTIAVAGVGSTTTWASGGYSFQLAPGTYTVTASGGGLSAPLTTTVTLGSTNYRLSFTSGEAIQGGVLPGAGSGGVTTPSQPSSPSTPTLPVNLGGVASSLSHSTENLTNFVVATYQNFLKRAPDTAGLNFWVGQLAAGATTDERIEASFIGSQEYIANHGGTNAAWVTSMYQDLLGRAPAASEVNYWVSEMAGGMSPSGVAFGFAASAEREGIRIAQDYQKFLKRAPASSEINYWVVQFSQGASNEAIEASLLGSQEFYTVQAQGDPGTWVNDAYQLVLDRAATASEIEYWVSVAE